MRRGRRGRARGALWLTVLALVVARCGGGAPPASAPARVAAPAPDAARPTEAALDGLRVGLADAGLRAGQDFVWVEPGAVPPPDLWLAAAPAELRAALAGAGARPVVFTAVIDPLAAGAHPPSWARRWLPWLLRDPGTPVTGVSATSDFEALLGAAAPLLGTRPVGVVFAPDDAESQAWHARLRAATAPAGRPLHSEPLLAGDGAAGAVTRLCARGAGALIALGDHATDAVYAELRDAAFACGIPVLGTRREHAAGGAVVTLARDERGAGRAAGLRAAAAVRGDDAGALGFAERPGAQAWIINAEAAERAGLGLPLSLIERADEVLGD